MWRHLTPDLCKRSVRKWDAIYQRVYHRLREPEKLNKYFCKPEAIDAGKFLEPNPPSQREENKDSDAEELANT